jgi:hypothetical protein
MSSVSTTLEPLPLATVRIGTFLGAQPLTDASGFFFSRDERLFLVTSRHVMSDEPSGHFPDRLEIELHTDADDLAVSTGFSIPLYRHGESLWHQGFDAAGDIDVAVIEIERAALPASSVLFSFTPQHLPARYDEVEMGSSLLIVGFPLGFHDTLHHMPVARHAVVASSYGLRFKGEGYFLTDARTHRGSSGSPVVMRMRESQDQTFDLPWTLIGIHSARLDVGTRDLQLDEALGLNCAWYSDILMTLTTDQNP